MVEKALQAVIDSGHGEIVIKVTDHRIMQIDTVTKMRCIHVKDEFKESKDG